ncbi:MAG: MBL fold metallo-hydrolase [Treponema sp.]|nr:MBL fold metallo-hydrolase [Treponema sp.]
MQQYKVHSLTVGPIATNCYIIETEERIGIIIDPGYDAQAIIARMEALKIVPRYILCTHGHFDHILAIPDIRNHYEQKQIPVEIIIHRMDKDYIGKNALIRHRRDLAGVGGLAFLERFPRQFPEASRIVEEGDRIGPFTVLHLPGHTPGSAAYFDEHRGIIFTGDTLFSGGVGRTDLPGGDEIALQASLRRLYGLPGSTRVYSGHGSETRIERERPRHI